MELIIQILIININLNYTNEIRQHNIGNDQSSEVIAIKKLTFSA